MISPDILAGKAEFDALRVKLNSFESGVSGARQQALGSLDRASTELHVALLAIAIGLALVVAGLATVLRVTAIRPVHVLAAEARGSPTATSATRWPRPGRGRYAAWPPT